VSLTGFLAQNVFIYGHERNQAHGTITGRRGWNQRAAIKEHL
jgi:hypothetical protein